MSRHDQVRQYRADIAYEARDLLEAALPEGLSQVRCYTGDSYSTAAFGKVPGGITVCCFGVLDEDDNDSLKGFAYQVTGLGLAPEPEIGVDAEEGKAILTRQLALVRAVLEDIPEGDPTLRYDVFREGQGQWGRHYFGRENGGYEATYRALISWMLDWNNGPTPEQEAAIRGLQKPGRITLKTGWSHHMHIYCYRVTLDA